MKEYSIIILLEMPFLIALKNIHPDVVFGKFMRYSKEYHWITNSNNMIQILFPAIL